MEDHLYHLEGDHPDDAETIKVHTLYTDTPSYQWPPQKTKKSKVTSFNSIHLLLRLSKTLLKASSQEPTPNLICQQVCPSTL